MRKVILQEFISLEGFAADATRSVGFVPAATAGDHVNAGGAELSGAAMTRVSCAESGTTAQLAGWTVVMRKLLCPVRGLAMAGIAIGFCLSAAAAQQSSYESLNACQRLPSAAIAAAVSGRAVDERPVNFKGLTAARCIYGIEIAGTRRVFVVWVNPVGDFDGLRQASDPPIVEVKGVGDAAFATTDPDTKRIQLTARSRTVTVQVTSERMDWAQAVARVALSKF